MAKKEVPIRDAMEHAKMKKVGGAVKSAALPVKAAEVVKKMKK